MNRKYILHLYLLGSSLLIAIWNRIWILSSFPLNHEIGVDNFFYHIEVNILLAVHKYTWWIHPLSLWGLYPYSDSPGAPTLVAQIAILSGLSVEYSILLFDFLIVIFSGITMYILALIIKRSPYFTFFSTLVFITAPVIVLGNIWNIGERVFLIFFSPLLSIFMIYILQKKHIKIMSILFILILFIMSTIHLITIFMYGLILAFLILKVINMSHLIKRFIWIIISRKWLKIALSFIILFMAFYSIFILNIFFDLPYIFSIEQYQHSAFLKGKDPIAILLNISISVTGGVGILLPIFLPLGLLYIMFKSNNDLKEKFIFLAFIFTLPIIINRTYYRAPITFLSSLLIGYGTMVLFTYKRKSVIDKKRKVASWKSYLKAILIVSLIISSSIFTIEYINYRKMQMPREYAVNYSMSATEFTYQVGIYQKNRIREIWICNDWLMAQRIQAYSNIPMQPATTSGALKNNPLYYQLVNNTTLGIFKHEKAFWYTGRWYYSEYYITQRNDYQTFFKNQISSGKVSKIIRKYNIYYLVELKDIAGNFSGYESKKTYRSELLQTVDEMNYVIFINNKYKIYYMNIM